MAGHKHAQQMMDYAEDAKVSDTPWDKWQMSIDPRYRPNEYHDLGGHPSWSTDHSYRRKPRTININGYEVPEPLRTAPAANTRCYLVRGYIYPFEFRWEHLASSRDAYLKMGMIHLTKEAAELHSKALRSFTERD